MTTWRGTARSAGVALAGLLGLAAVALRDAEAAAMAIGVALAVVLSGRGKGRLGALGAGVISANVAFWMTSGAVSNLMHGASVFATALPALLSVAALATLAATVAWRVKAGDGGARPFTVIASVVAIAALVVSVAAHGRGVSERSGDLTLVAEHVHFSATKLTASSQHVAVYVTNKDLFWHTFTIDALHVDLGIPVGAHRRIVFDARAGAYRFACKIPGHEQAGMKGTLIVP